MTPAEYSGRPLSRIAETFSNLKSKGERALVLFVTAGDPSLDQLPAILGALTEGGADIIEVGLPFSDPIADGPTIQAASQRALDRGTTTSAVFEVLAGFQGPPLVLMGYMNPILRMGADTFASRAAKGGVEGTIVCDLTPDEASDWIAVSRASGLDNIFLSAPTSTDERLDLVCQRSSGFVYAVSRTGVTGSAKVDWSDTQRLVEKLKTMTSLPVCVGFGVRSAEDVKNVCAFADGAVIGSWLVDFLEKEWQGGEGRERLVAAVRELKAATR